MVTDEYEERGRNGIKTYQAKLNASGAWSLPVALDGRVRVRTEGRENGRVGGRGGV